MLTGSYQSATVRGLGSQDTTTFFVSWNETIKPYTTNDIATARRNQHLHRMFVNENPVETSEKIFEAVANAV